ncbi:MAG: ammonium transporter [Saprospiraceae bacterium]|nr:ammonium transporter [Saprospiraceae bacterium]
MDESLTIAKEALKAAEQASFVANNTWMLVATVLVFIMHLGFATLESGFVQRKNVVNILFKNVMIVSLGILSYYFIGFGLMYPGAEGGFFAFGGFGLNNPESLSSSIDYAEGNYTYYTDFIFQGMFAATCCTIVSGAVAERIKLLPFLFFCLLFVSLSYPVTGYWKWGAGWLDAEGFYDFAGSTLVHSVGGWGALAGAILLGPRTGKYGSKGIKPIPGHSMPLASVGVFLLWFGWFGFNGGSVLSADPDLVSLVFVTTTLAAAAGGIGSFLISKLVYKSFDLGMVLNGILGGLVGITASADGVLLSAALLIGFVAGVLIPLSVNFFDKIKIDDPVGATSVHLVCGIWGTIAVAIFGNYGEGVGTLSIQLLGIGAVGLFTFSFAFFVFYIIKVTVGIRVNKEEEIQGLDIGEHQAVAYQ